MSITAQYVVIPAEEYTELMSGKKSIDYLLSEESQPAMVSSAKPDQLELAIRRYARADHFNRKRIADKAGLSEKDMLFELKKRGLHIWFDLDKNWQEMHVLLTGKPVPLHMANARVSTDLLSIAVMAEDNFPGDYSRYGYGPSRYVDTPKVKEITAALAKLDFAQLNDQHEPVDGDEADWFAEVFEDFKRLYQMAADNNGAIGLIYM